MVEEIKPRVSVPARPGWLSNLLPVVFIIWGFVGVYLLQLAIDSTGKERMREKVVAELMYFPSGKFVREASIEYQQVAADFVWLRGIQYYGYHLMTDRKYEWLGHVFGILTTLDPKFIGAYHFGALTLAWDAHKPNEAVRLLVRGMEANPTNWQLPFYAGFINYMLLKDYEAAGIFFDIASKLPGAWLVVSRWAAVSVAKAGRSEAAREMWLDIYRSTENKALRKLVIRQLSLLKFNDALKGLQQAVDRFHEDKGRFPRNLQELVRTGYVGKIPEEPFGGRFFLEGGKVRSSTPPSRRG
ncbi:hypothetical protein CH330_06075 [candidate division WOR-3 bacterium JGI_Cruoil_03_51_56]|uniref:Tetratricopeptide repeat protein n=1 Tax=candidate division WOR-3 bacterium JGI_Cruoil_03_51_56 TaxID=1973747 RepID=A0A235BSY6_UNCW3|nr:MAG: hypothetical protein CH330_06075 [candidate division WOR-3 bacterium JGI_Cruoil_03_51_56]